MGTPLLQIESLVAGYDKTDVLDEVSFALCAGTLAYVTGIRGAGKTTLLKSIAGLIKPKRGVIRFDGEDLRRKRPNELLARGIAYVPCNRLLFSSLSVRDNLCAALWRDTDRLRTEEQARQLAQRLPFLKDCENQTAVRLTDGQRQLLAIARALMSRPRLLLLDDPFNALVPADAEQVADLGAELAEAGTAVVVTQRCDAPAPRPGSQTYLLERGRLSHTESSHASSWQGLAAASS